MFLKAEPIWLTGRENELNCHAAFTCRTALSAPAEIYITAATYYRVWVNGKFLAFGPARAAKRYARVDILPLPAGECDIRIEVAGFACCSLSTAKTPSFLQAELRQGDHVIAYTGRDFAGFYAAGYVQAVQRYSIQRHFTEAYDHRVSDEPNEVSVINYRPIPLSRHVPYPYYGDVAVNEALLGGTLSFDASIRYQNEYSWREIPEGWGRFANEALPNSYTWLQRHHQFVTFRNRSLPLTLKEGEYAVFDFGQIEAGFIDVSWRAVTESDLCIYFAEYYEGDTFVLKNFHAHNVLEYFSAAGQEHRSLCFEPYTCRFVLITPKSGEVTVERVGLKSYTVDPDLLHYEVPADPALASICSAAKRTYAHNAVDIYMDCPSRERAGWLCDSYFTAKTEYALTGQTKVEDVFLENYRLFENEGDLPEGALPMCYPSDIMENHNKHFIPQWTMWYILELGEYILERGHEDQKEPFQKSIYGLLDFYKKYENEDGLLERLPSWNFVEWSSANDWTWDVNYPTNFLYAGVLETVWKLYGDEECLAKCRKVRERAIKASFNGTYFQDHSKRDENGVLRLQPQASQACQYYALLFGKPDMRAPEYAQLLDMILHKFDPDLPMNVPAIMDVNAFIGAYLRLEALLKLEEYELALTDVKKFFGSMDEKTKTLWENRTIKGSNDHGFASYALVVIQKALQGLGK